MIPQLNDEGANEEHDAIDRLLCFGATVLIGIFLSFV